MALLQPGELVNLGLSEEATSHEPENEVRRLFAAPGFAL